MRAQQLRGEDGVLTAHVQSTATDRVDGALAAGRERNRLVRSAGAQQPGSDHPADRSQADHADAHAPRQVANAPRGTQGWGT